MVDTRETILSALLVVLQGIGGYTVLRTDLGIDDGARPSIVLDDGAEVVTTQPPRGGHAPMIVTMKPALLVCCGDPAGSGGAAANEARAKILGAVLNDTTIPTLLGVHGQFKYLGCQTTIDQGELLLASLILNFEIDYVLNPKALKEN